MLGAVSMNRDRFCCEIDRSGRNLKFPFCITVYFDVFCFPESQKTLVIVYLYTCVMVVGSVKSGTKQTPNNPLSVILSAVQSCK